MKLVFGRARFDSGEVEHDVCTDWNSGSRARTISMTLNTNPVSPVVRLKLELAATTITPAFISACSESMISTTDAAKPAP